MSYHGRCACGAVEIKVTGDPAFEGYCHCGDCRDWLGAPLHAATLWAGDQFTVVHGTEDLLTYQRSEKSLRKSCCKCGGALFVEHPGMGMVDVLASRLEGFDFNPVMHVFYGERMIDLNDELPKFTNLPVEMDGDGKIE